MKQTYGIDPFDGLHGMEQIFNMLYSDSQSGTRSDACLNAYWALLKMYRASIQQTTDNLRGNSRSGVGALTKFLLNDNPQRELTFITFNQDLVIEKALDDIAKTVSYTLPWSILEAYGISFSGFLTMQVNSKPFVHDNTFKTAPVRVLKLHGSTNWVYTVRSAKDARNCLRTPKNSPYCLNDQEIRPTVRLVGETKTQTTLPLIVPPIYEKVRHTTKMLKPIWNEARNALSTSDECIVFGYSFPDTDIAAYTMIRAAFHLNPNTPRIHVIDIDPHIAAKLSAINVGAFCEYYCSA
jgi:hypothetical protein